MNAPSLRPYLLTWIALLALLGLTTASALLPLGGFNLVVNLGIAAIKAALVAAVFMHVARGGTMVRVVALAGLVWLSLLIGLSMTDLAVRGG